MFTLHDNQAKHLTETPLEQYKKPKELLLVAVGDIMVHDSQLESTYQPSTGKYDFSGWFSDISKYLQEADLAVGNLETTLAGANLQYSGYPVFNSPESLAWDLKNAGFSLVSTANNHCLDRREKGIYRTIEHLEAAGLKHFGTARSAEEREKGLIVNKNGIKVSFLAYTSSTNGIPIPNDKTYLVNMIDEDLIKKDIMQAKKQGAQLVVVALHWGKEYSREASPEQQKLAEKIIAWGGDLILGSHPHVLQPVEYITVQTVTEKRNGIVIYSLGNFIADQPWPYTDSGLILRIRYIYDPEEGIRVAEINCVPTWIHKYHHEGRRQFRVLAVADALSAYKEGDPFLNENDYRRLQEVWEETLEHIWLNPYSLKK